MFVFRRGILKVVFFCAVVLFNISLTTLEAGPFRILIATTESAPFVQSGGLGVVLAANALPAGLANNGQKVTLIMPMWSHLYENENIKATNIFLRTPMPWGEHGETRMIEAQLYEAKVGNINYIFVGEPYQSGLFQSLGQRPDYNGDSEKKLKTFSYFSKAVLEYAKHKGNNYFDIIYSNDWMTGLIPWYRNNWGIYQGITAKTIHIIHSTRPETQGQFGLNDGHWFAQIDWKYLTNPTKDYSLIHNGAFNITAGAIKGADAVQTVSPRTASDIQIAQFGYGLEGILKYVNDNKQKIIGIGHGVDKNFSPSNAPFPYTINNFAEGKRKNKIHFMEWLNLYNDSEIPLPRKIFASTSRLSAQKSHLEQSLAIKHLLESGVAEREGILFVIMGDYNTTDPYSMDVKEKYESLMKQYPNNFVLLGFNANKDKQLLLVAASDGNGMFSKEEYGGMCQKCGNVMRTFSVANAVNGIADDVIDGVTGIVIKEPSVEGIIEGYLRAIELINNEKELDRITRNCMEMTPKYNWDNIAETYIEQAWKLIENVTHPTLQPRIDFIKNRIAEAKNSRSYDQAVSKFSQAKVEIDNLRTSLNPASIKQLETMLEQVKTELNTRDLNKIKDEIKNVLGYKFRTNSIMAVFNFAVDKMNDINSPVQPKIAELLTRVVLGEPEKGNGLIDLLHRVGKTTEAEDLAMVYLSQLHNIDPLSKENIVLFNQNFMNLSKFQNITLKALNETKIIESRFLRPELKIHAGYRLIEARRFIIK